MTSQEQMDREDEVLELKIDETGQLIVDNFYKYCDLISKHWQSNRNSHKIRSYYYEKKSKDVRDVTESAYHNLNRLIIENICLLHKRLYKYKDSNISNEEFINFFDRFLVCDWYVEMYIRKYRATCDNGTIMNVNSSNMTSPAHYEIIKIYEAGKKLEKFFGLHRRENSLNSNREQTCVRNKISNGNKGKDKKDEIVSIVDQIISKRNMYNRILQETHNSIHRYYRNHSIFMKKIGEFSELPDKVKELYSEPIQLIINYKSNIRETIVSGSSSIETIENFIKKQSG